MDRLSWSMPRVHFSVTIIAATLGLAACGDHLGDYEVEDVQLVREFPREEDTFDETANLASHYGSFLRIELSSRFNLNSADTGGGLYTDADFCPLRNTDRIIAFEPRGPDGFAIENWKRTRPFTRASQDGRYHYFVYVVPASPRRKLFSNSVDEIPGYDVRTSQRALCLRFFVPGYNITPSVSDTIEVSPEALQRAFAASQSRT